MRRFRVVLEPDGHFNVARGLEVREGRGRWRQWTGPFDETWRMGHADVFVGPRMTQVVDRTGRTQWGRTAPMVYRAA